MKRILYSKRGRDRIDEMHKDILYLETLLEDEQQITENTNDRASLTLIQSKQNLRSLSL